MRTLRGFARAGFGIGALLLAFGLTLSAGLTADGSAIGGGARNGVDIRDPSHQQGITISRRALTSEPYRVAGYSFYGTSLVANVNSGGSTTNVTIDAATILSLRHGPQQHVAPFYTRIATNGTTTLKSSGAHLRNIVINTKGSGSNTLTVYDSPTGSGTIVGVLDTTVAGGSFVYDVELDDGLTIVTATGTPADVTVVWD